MRIILASQSPRRKALLTQCGIDYDALPAVIRESLHPGESPESAAMRLAREKAQAAAAACREDGRWILAADTIVADGDTILGKPADADEARRMLRRLRGREHRVITGVCLLQSGGVWERTEAEVSRVRMRAYAEVELEAYAAGGDGLDKAGAYAVQDAVFRPAAAVEGCYSNVVGLPLCRVYELFEAAGLALGRPLPEGCRTRGRCAFATTS